MIHVLWVLAPDGWRQIISGPHWVCQNEQRRWADCITEIARYAK